MRICSRRQARREPRLKVFLRRDIFPTTTKRTRMIEFNADKVKLNGPYADNGWKVTFEIGEYERRKLKDIIDIEPMTRIKVKVEVEKEF
jgi:hypothetical protein